ncbi:MAG: GNAT family N-acetyltransferase [Coriobacteriia bacterium]
MRDHYRVVPASPEHVSALPEIERAAATLFEDAVPAALLEHATPVHVLFGSQQTGTLWVALGQNDEPVGFARAVVDGPRVHLAELDVLPAHGRRGVGSSLVRAVTEWARAVHAREVTLTTYRDLPWNAPFYARLGFTVVPEDDWDADLRHRFDEEAGLESERSRRVVMRRPLDSASQAAQSEPGPTGRAPR